MPAATGGARPRKRGNVAEDLAERWFTERGAFVLARNFPSRYGELDLVVAEGELVVFVEVRRRRAGSAVDALASVTPAKARKVVLAAQEYVARAGIDDRPLRFDVLSVTPRGRGRPAWIERIEGAFDASVLGD